MVSLRESRIASAQYLNSLSRDELFRSFGITRVARIDTLDQIGVPVFSAIRPLAKTVSVSAGKGTDRALARAGAVAEAVECFTFENPRGSFEVGPFRDVDPRLLPLALHSDWTPDTPIAIEPVTHISGRECLLPSDLIWIDQRIRTRNLNFQMTSNGQAIAGTFEVAFQTALEECIERDQMVLRLLSHSALGIYPPRTAIWEQNCDLEERIAAASLCLYLFLCTIDMPRWVYWAILIDPYTQSGTYAGWGCDRDPQKAQRAAILESIQSRAVYISGARDDIDRLSFARSRSEHSSRLKDEIEALPCAENFALPQGFDSLDHIYFKRIELDGLVAVKVIVLGLEQPIGPAFRSMRWEKLRESFMSDQACTVRKSRDFAASFGALQRLKAIF